LARGFFKLPPCVNALCVLFGFQHRHINIFKLTLARAIYLPSYDYTDVVFPPYVFLFVLCFPPYIFLFVLCEHCFGSLVSWSLHFKSLQDL
jgi:hypothetical protein